MSETFINVALLETKDDKNWHERQVMIPVPQKDHTAHTSNCVAPIANPILSTNPKRLLLTHPFVDFHLHLNQHGKEGQTAGKTLLPWLNDVIFPYETLQKQDAQQAQKIAQDFLQNCRKFGTMTVVALCGISGHERAQWAELLSFPQSQLNLCIPTPVVMDRLIPDALKTIPHELDNFLKYLSLPLTPTIDTLTAPIIWGLCLRFLPSSSVQLLELISQWVTNSPQTWFTTHFSENKDEGKLVGELFGRDLSYTQHLENLGLLHSKTVLAHGIHIDEIDLNIMRKRNVILAHCPTSNEELQSGRCPIEQYLEKGIDWGLGCDIGAGPTINFLDVIRCFESIHQEALKSRGLNQDQIACMALHRATQGGMKLLRDRDERIAAHSTSNQAWSDYLVWDHPSFNEKMSALEKWRVLVNDRDIEKSYIIAHVTRSGLVGLTG